MNPEPCPPDTEASANLITTYTANMSGPADSAESTEDRCDGGRQLPVIFDPFHYTLQVMRTYTKQRNNGMQLCMVACTQMMHDQSSHIGN